MPRKSRKNKVYSAELKLQAVHDYLTHNSATIESLKAMRFGAMAAELERQIQDPATYSHMGFEERVALLVDAECGNATA